MRRAIATGYVDVTDGEPAYVMDGHYYADDDPVVTTRPEMFESLTPPPPPKVEALPAEPTIERPADERADVPPANASK